MSYWPHLFNKTPPTPTSIQEGRLDWDDAMRAQQRFWSEWMEAGQLWMSWWVSTLPSVGWPPAGVVLPPAPSETATPAAHAESEKATQDIAAAASRQTPRKPRAPVVRHH